MKGELYFIHINRQSNRWRSTGTNYYFTLSDENAWVKVDGAASAEIEFYGDEGSYFYDVTSSGYWTAQTDDHWLLLNGKRMDQAELDERNALPEEYARYGNTSGNRLYISALANTTGKPRTGTVTVRCGGASATIHVYQLQRYSIAALTSPQLSETSASPTKLPYGDVNLRWSPASGGTGRYMVKVEESDKPRTGYSTVVLKKEGLSSTSCTIPVGKLSEGKYYRVFLGTEITAEECPGQSYYFQLSYENELAVTAQLVSSSVDLGRAISVFASATGGSGGYVYTYILYSGDTELMRSSPTEGLEYYTFPTTQAGKYRVVVWVEDSSGETAKFDTSSITVSDVPDYVYIGDATSASAELPSAGGSLTRTVRSKSNWIWSCDQSWLQIDATGAANSSLTVSASANATGASRQATVYVASGDARATLTVTQYPSSSLECVPSGLSFSNAAGSDSISVTSSGAWTASASESWIQISKTSGVSGDRVVVTVSENAGSARSGSVRFSCGEQSRTVTVNQSASSATRVTRVYGVAPVQTGEETNLSVYAENAVYVRMIVDGVELAEQYSVNEFGVAYVRYKFSQSGRRRVEFSACGYDGVWTQPDPALAAVLDVTAPNGALDPVRFGALQEKYNRGDSVTVSWSDGGKAENYVAYVYKDDALLRKAAPGEGGMTKNSLALTSAELSQAGHYSICVMSTGKGYDQSSSATSFDIQYEAYLHCKSAALYNDAGMSSYRGGLRFGDKYTVESEQTTASGMQIARIRDAQGTVGYCDATLLGEEYWHPCLKDGVLVHTFANGEQHRPEHPHKKYRVCTVCEEEVDILGPDGQPTYTMPTGSSSANCCDCGNHVYGKAVFFEKHPHYLIQECINCGKQVKDYNTCEEHHPNCPECGDTDAVCTNHDWVILEDRSNIQEHPHTVTMQCTRCNATKTQNIKGLNCCQCGTREHVWVRRIAKSSPCDLHQTKYDCTNCSATRIEGKKYSENCIQCNPNEFDWNSITDKDARIMSSNYYSRYCRTEAFKEKYRKAPNGGSWVSTGEYWGVGNAPADADGYATGFPTNAIKQKGICPVYETYITPEETKVLAAYMDNQTDEALMNAMEGLYSITKDSVVDLIDYDWLDYTDKSFDLATLAVEGSAELFKTNVDQARLKELESQIVPAIRDKRDWLVVDLIGVFFGPLGKALAIYDMVSGLSYASVNSTLQSAAEQGNGIIISYDIKFVDNGVSPWIQPQRALRPSVKIWDVKNGRYMHTNYDLYGSYYPN